MEAGREKERDFARRWVVDEWLMSGRANEELSCRTGITIKRSHRRTVPLSRERRTHRILLPPPATLPSRFTLTSPPKTTLLSGSDLFYLIALHIPQFSPLLPLRELFLADDFWSNLYWIRSIIVERISDIKRIFCLVSRFFDYLFAYYWKWFGNFSSYILPNVLCVLLH